MLAKKLQQAVAGAAAGEALYVENVFSTYLYTGNGGTQLIENGIRLGDSYGSGSAYFDGSGDYLQSTVSALSGQFTIEFWVYRPAAGNNFFFTLGDSSTSTGAEIYIGSSGTQLNYYSNNAVRINGGTPPASGAWAYIALTRDSSNDVRMYVNGSQVGSAYTQSSTIDTTLRLGVEYYSSAISGYLTGYLSNFRISNTVRTVTTVPTAQFSSDGNTVFLALQGDAPFTDNSSNAFTITQYGNVAAKSFGPFTSDVAGEGGLVWIKERNNISTPALFDTARGTGVVLSTTNTSANISTDALTAFNTDGFSVKYPNTNDFYVNRNTQTYASWTFRKAPKFFDVVTYTGTGSAQNISHNLGSVPGCIIVKRTNTAGYNWAVYHRSVGNTKFLTLNTTSSEDTNSGYWNNTTPTDSVFTVGTNSTVNDNGGSYVAYLFAHDAGGFGDSGDQSVITCGTYTGDGTTSGPAINLGWEPQWLLTKASSSTGSWILSDSIRPLGAWNGTSSGGVSSPLFANSTSGEDTGGDYPALLTTGFYPTNQSGNVLNQSGVTYIYIAIRRGPMKTPESGTEVFSPNIGTDSSDWTFDAGFPVDLHMYHNRASTSDTFLFDRLRGSYYLTANTTNAETSYTVNFDKMNYVDVSGSNNNGWMMWNFRRAPGFFDVVCYTGDGVAGREITHNLTVSPELIIAKARDYSGGRPWPVYHSGVGASKFLYLNQTDGAFDNTLAWYGVEPTSTVFTVGSNSVINYSATNYVAYLFASVPGVSKVGSYTGNGGSSSNVIDCGFSNGARFVLIKKSSSSGSGWGVYDTSRGIVTGADKRLFLNSTAAEDEVDVLDPNPVGFELNDDTATTNTNGETYIFLAIA